MKIEVCIESVDEARAAHHYGLTRVEVCGALDIGGITPPASLIEYCANQIQPECHVMIRPRGGNFAYSQTEIDLMAKDIRTAAKLGANGVVFGCLTTDNNLDVHSNKRLSKVAGDCGLEATLHRAFDLCPNTSYTQEALLEIGFTRILTSGRASSVTDGYTTLRDIVKTEGQTHEIMAGGGVNETNAKRLAETGVDALHFSIRKSQFGSAQMGSTYVVDHEKIKSILHEIST